MIIIDCVQNSVEWHTHRIGIPTASNFDKIVTSKGEPSKQRKKYMYQLAGERILGKAEETYQNGSMLRGQELENEARNLYQMLTDEEVKKIGFCLVGGKFKYGSSPDSFVGEDGGLEIKCPNLSTHVQYLMDGDLPTDYFQQVQGNMLVTGRKWWDFASYYPGLKPLVFRVYREEKFILALKDELEKFCQELDEIVKKIS